MMVTTLNQEIRKPEVILHMDQKAAVDEVTDFLRLLKPEEVKEFGAIMKGAKLMVGIMRRAQ